MIEWIAAVFLVVGFVILMQLFKLGEKSRSVINSARHSLGVIRSTHLDDDAKEASLQANAIELFRLFFLITLGGAAAVLVPLGSLWLLDQIGLISLTSVLAVALSPVFLISSGVLAIFALYMGSHKDTKTPGYSALDRALHRVAFRTYAIQVPIADMETQMFAKQIAQYKIERPVFITSLPRAGTTLLLECCVSVPEFAAHCYRDMPFVLTPCLWNRFSANFQIDGEARERFHKDGMLINFNSPEALEEILWKIFWRRHYHRDRIIPWRSEDNPEFAEFFRSHIRKIIHLRRGKAEYAATARYVSKNNLNIARTEMLQQLFPDCIIVVPFRQPLHHAASMLGQHRNFSDMHNKDRFASEYMRAIGHYDFGNNLRPVDFDGWLDARESKDADSLTFWLEYWVAGYKWLLKKNTNSLCFLSYEEFCRTPKRGLAVLADVTGCSDANALLAAASTIHSIRSREVDTKTIPESLVEEAKFVHEKLKEAAKM